MNTKTIKFDLNKFKLYEKIKAKQGDTKSRFLLFQLLDGSAPFNLKNRSVRAYMIKPDGKEIFNDLIVNNYNLGYCTLELTNQVLAVPGTLKIELMVTEGDKKLTSSVFELEVVKSINSEKSIVSTNEFTALLNGLAALSEYDNYKNSVKEMEINKANKAEVEEKFISVEEKIKNNSEQLEHKTQQLENLKATKQEVDIERKRIDSLTSLPNGSTTGDAELIDGRNTFFGTTANNIGEAIRKQMGAIYNGIYYLDLNWELGEMDSTNGENGNTINPTQIRTKDFISIPLNVDIKFELTTDYNYFILKYDEDKAYQGYEGIYTNGVNNLNTDCPYIKIAMANSSYDTNVTVDMGTKLKSYFKINSFKDIDDRFTVVNEEILNIKDGVTTDVLNNAKIRNCYLVCQEHSKKVYVDTFNQTITFPPSYICLSNKLLKATNEQIINYSVTNEFRWLYYNKTTELIELVTFYKDDSNYYFLGLFYPDMPNNSYCNFKFLVDKPLSIGFLGDSITYGLGGTSWTTRISELCGIPTVYNYGVSGTTIISNGSTGFIDRISSMIDGLGAIGLWGGVNDFMWTNQSKEAFKANFEKVVKALLDKYPKAKIIGFTPMKFKYTADAPGILTRAWNEPNSQSGVLLKDYVDAEIEIFNKYSIEYKDLFNEGGISCEHEGQSNEYFVGNGDLLHPNTKGNLLVLAPKIANTINSII